MTSNPFLPSIPPSIRPFVTIPLLTLTFYIIPTTIHKTVQSVDVLYAILDRRARSPYEAPVSIASILAAGALMLVWHTCLALLGYVAVGDKNVEAGKGKGFTWNWDRVLGRIIIPFMLLVLGIQFGWEVVGRFTMPGELVVGNAV